MNNERKKSKEDFGHFYGKPVLRQNPKMTSKKKDELRYFISYIYEARRQPKTFPKVEAKKLQKQRNKKNKNFE